MSQYMKSSKYLTQPQKPHPDTFIVTRSTSTSTRKVTFIIEIRYDFVTPTGGGGSNGYRLVIPLFAILRGRRKGVEHNQNNVTIFAICSFFLKKCSIDPSDKYYPFFKASLNFIKPQPEDGFVRVIQNESISVLGLDIGIGRTTTKSSGGVQEDMAQW